MNSLDIRFPKRTVHWNQSKQGHLERNAKEDLHCTPSTHTTNRTLLRQINWLQSTTQFQCCYKFSRCASMAGSPTIGDVKSLNKLARQIKSQPLKLQYWPLTGDASYRNNDDREAWQCWQNRVSDQRMECHMGVLVDYESQKIKKIVLSTTVAELCSFMKCCGSFQLLRGLWMDLSDKVTNIHMRTDAKNLVTTARTIHLPGKKGDHSHDLYVAKGSLFRK